jgi:hypothetical protein
VSTTRRLRFGHADPWRQPRRHGSRSGGERHAAPPPADPDPTGNRAQRRAAQRLGVTVPAHPRKPGMATYIPPGTGTATPAHLSANRPGG